VVNRSYALKGLGFGVRTTSEEFAAWLDQALETYRVTTEAQPYYSIVIADGPPTESHVKERYHVLYRGTLAIAKTPDLFTLLRTFVSDMASFVYDQREDAIYADVVPVWLGGVCGLVPAVLIPYLTTLGRRRLQRSGLTLPAETAVAVSLDSGMVMPMPTIVSLASRSLETLAGVFPLEGQDQRATVERPLAVDVVLSIGSGDEQLSPVTKGIALYRLASHVANLDQLGEKAVLGLRPLVERARCFELGSGTPAGLLAGLLTALRAS